MRAIGAGILFILTMAGASPGHADQTAHGCSAKIDVSSWNIGNCTVEEEGNTLTVKWPGAGTIKYLARLEVSGDQADASWSGIGGSSTATEALGRLSKDGNCWFNDKASICFATDNTAAASEDADPNLADDIALEVAGDQVDRPPPIAAPTGDASSFRGIQLGMTKAQIEGALNDEFSLSDELPSPAGDPRSSDGIYDMNLMLAMTEIMMPNGAHFGSHYIINRDNQLCGEMSFADSRVDKIRLGQCYFDIRGRITLSDFVRQIIDTYGLEDGMEGSAKMVKGPYGPIEYTQYAGVRNATSERFVAAMTSLTNAPTLTIEKIPSINFN
ncbi:MAG: hypothetical protein ACTHKQ_18105 [Mesorhizobium sp.]